MTHGPLSDVRVVEFSGIGPGPFAAMMLADMGAEIVSIVRPGSGPPPTTRFMMRGRTMIELDAKSDQGRNAALALIEQADLLIEGFRPGVMERLGLGPDAALERNSALIYGRMTGWGQHGPLARTAGHDINYIALTGALDSIRGNDGAPAVPLNLVGDYGGGSLFLLVGLLAALHESKSSGKGQVVDAAIVDGALSLMTPTYAFRASGGWPGEPGANLLDGGAHFYRTYECADGKYIAVGAAEPQFYRSFLQGLGVTDPMFERQMDRHLWPELTRKAAKVIKTRDRDEWASIFDGTDACVTPVLSLAETSRNAHVVARGGFITNSGHAQPATAPRLSRTPLKMAEFRPNASKVEAILAAWTKRAAA